MKKMKSGAAMVIDQTNMNLEAGSANQSYMDQ